MFAAAAANEEHAAMVREFVGREIFVRLIERLTEGADPGSPGAGGPSVELRAALGAGQLIGMGVLRYVVKVPALADATVEEIVAILGPTLQEHLVPSHP
jgi:hypothetical protein